MPRSNKWDVFPDPWGQIITVGPIEGHSNLVRLVATVPWEDDEDLANANLISAAPQMKEELKYLIALLEDEGYSDFILGNARDAVAKAEGRQHGTD